MARGSIGQATSIIVYRPRPRRARPKKVTLARDVYCYRCQSLIAAGTEFMKVRSRRFEHLECYRPPRKKETHKPGPITITRIDPKPATSL